MHTFACQGVEICSQRSYQSFTFTCLHLSDSTLVKDHTADELYSEMLHAETSNCTLTAYGECLRQYVVDGLKRTFLAFLSYRAKTLLELDGLGTQLIVGQRLHLLIVRFNYVYYFLNLLDLTLIEVSKNLFC